MRTDSFEQLKELAESHGMEQVPGQRLDCVRFEKLGLSVETCNFLDYIVVRANEHGSTLKQCPSLAEVAKSLGGP